MLSSSPGMSAGGSANSNGKEKLLGYVLTSVRSDIGLQSRSQLEYRCKQSGYDLTATECEFGYQLNPMRPGLWKVLRKLVCSYCEPKRMPLSVMNFADFLHQALSPCMCRHPQGQNGIIVLDMAHVTSDKEKGAQFVLELARIGKHVFAQDGICLSCCHPAARQIVRKMVSN